MEKYHIGTHDVMEAMIDLRSIGEIRVGSSPTVCITVFEILLKSKIQNIKFEMKIFYKNR